MCLYHITDLCIVLNYPGEIRDSLKRLLFGSNCVLPPTNPDPIHPIHLRVMQFSALDLVINDCQLPSYRLRYYYTISSAETQEFYTKSMGDISLSILGDHACNVGQSNRPRHCPFYKLFQTCQQIFRFLLYYRFVCFCFAFISPTTDIKLTMTRAGLIANNRISDTTIQGDPVRLT